MNLIVDVEIVDDHLWRLPDAAIVRMDLYGMIR